MNRLTRIDKCKFLPILREFEKQWYPAKNTPYIVDFIIWLEDKGYEIKKEKKDVTTF